MAYRIIWHACQQKLKSVNILVALTNLQNFSDKSVSLCFLSTPLPVSKSYFLDLNALLIYDVRPQLSPRLLLDRILPLSFCWRCFRVAIYNFFPYFWSWYTYFVSAPLLTFDMYIVRFQYILIYFLIPNDAPSEQSKSPTNLREQ